MFGYLSAAHDSSLDDAGLMRRCERRVMMFPRYKHDLSLQSVDTTQSSAVPASSISLLDASGEGLSADSFQSSTMTPTDKRDTAVVVNTSLNRNPYQDGRRWAGEGDWSYPLNRARPESSAGTGCVRDCQANSLTSETGQQQCCLASSDNDCAKDNGRTDIASNSSSDNVPIIDNLILEPQSDFRQAATAKVKQHRTAARCTQHDPQRAIIYAWREAGSHGCENKKHKHKAALSRQAPCGRSQSQAGKGTLDPSSETYLQRLDSILQKMCVRSERTNSRVQEKMSRSTKEGLCSSVNKGRRMSPARKLHACPNTAGASSKLSIHDVIDEIKRVGHSKARAGTKVDIVRPERTAGAARPANRIRCPHRIDQKPVVEALDGSVSTSKEQTKQCSLPTSSSQRSTSGMGNGRTRSKSLSALPRCHTQTWTSASCAHRTPGKVHSCAATVNYCKCSANWGFRKITKQQQEILKHIPNDITPEEMGALMKTVLSIVERRHSLKGTARDGKGQDGPQEGTIPGREDVSKYHIRGQSESCNTQINLSTKPKTPYSYRAVDTSSHEPLPTTVSSQSSRDETDLPFLDADSGIENKSMNFGSLKFESVGSASGLASSSLPGDTRYKSFSSTSGVAGSSLPYHTKVKCQSSASGLAISSLPGDLKDDVRTSSLPLTSLRYSDSTSSGSEYSSRTHNVSTATAANGAASHKPQLFKQSAVVLPFDDTTLPRQRRRAQQGFEEACSHQQVTPNTSPGVGRPAYTSPEAGRPPHTSPEAGRPPHTSVEQGRTPHTTQNLSFVNEHKAASSRHIGWKCPLQTDRRTSQPSSDASLRGGNSLPVETGHGQVIRSESALSDGLLYVKSSNATRKLPPRELAHSSSTSHVVLPDARRAECGSQVRQPNGRKSSSSSLINDTDGAAGAGVALPPGPHEHAQYDPGQGDVLASQKSYTALKEAELDRKITDLKLEIQRSYQMPHMLPKATSGRSGATSSHTRNASERQSSFVKGEAGDEGKRRGEAPDLDALSCSVDTELTNTSISNRLQELDGEVSSSPDYKWRSNAWAVPAGTNSHLTSWPGQCEVHRRRQFSVYTNSAPIHRLDGVGLRSDLTADLAHQPSGLYPRGDGFQTYADDYKWKKHGMAGETCMGNGHILSDPAPRKFTDYSVGDMGWNRAPFQRQDLLPGAEKCFSNESEKVRNETENFLCGTGRYLPQGSRTTRPESSLQMCRNVEAHRGLDTARMYARASCTQLPGCLTQRRTFGLSSVETKLTASMEHHEEFKTTYSLDHSGTLKPPMGLEPPPSFTPYRRFEAEERMNIAASVEQSGNIKPGQDLAVTKQVDPASKTDPLDNQNMYNSEHPPTRMRLITTPHTPNNLQRAAESGDPTSTLESSQQGQANETITAKCKRSVKVKSTAARSTFRKTNLAQLKHHTQSLLVEVCRRYCTDTYVPSLGTAGCSDLASALEFLQNFSPISQVDVNTQYPVTTGSKQLSVSAEAAKGEQNNTSRPQQVTSEVKDCRNPGQMCTGSSRNRNTSSGSRVQKPPVKSSLRQGKKISKPATSCHRIVKSRVKGHARFVIQRPNHNNVDTRLSEVTPATSQLQCGKQSVRQTRETAETQSGEQTVAETRAPAQEQCGEQTIAETRAPAQTQCDKETVTDATTKSRSRGENRSVDAGGDTVVVDVTSHTSDRRPNDGDDTSAAKSDFHSVIWKKYSATSAMPVEVKELGSAKEDKGNTRADTHGGTRADTHGGTRAVASQKHPHCDSHRPPCTSAKIYDRKVDTSQNDTNTSCQDTPHLANSQCTIERLASAAAVARKMLASHMKHSGRMFSLADCSLTSDSCLETTTDSDISLQAVKTEDPDECRCSNSNINNDNNNNSNSHSPTSPSAGCLVSSTPPSLSLVLLQVSSCICRRMYRRRPVELLVDNRLQQRMDGLATSQRQESDDNESATAPRPCAKILGELAFQLERRILDYVFGMEGPIRRRFYGYTVNTICQMMNKESKNVRGNDDPLRKSELAFRLKKLLTCLKKVGYNIKKHGDFAQQIVNTYGLLPCPPDARTIQDFGLHNANCIAHLIDHLACDEDERENLHILLDSLKYLSKADSRPLFIW